MIFFIKHLNLLLILVKICKYFWRQFFLCICQVTEDYDQDYSPCVSDLVKMHRLHLPFGKSAFWKKENGNILGLPTSLKVIRFQTKPVWRLNKNTQIFLQIQISKQKNLSKIYSFITPWHHLRFDLAKNRYMCDIILEKKSYTKSSRNHFWFVILDF